MSAVGKSCSEERIYKNNLQKILDAADKKGDLLSNLAVEKSQTLKTKSLWAKVFHFNNKSSDEAAKLVECTLQTSLRRLNNGEVSTSEEIEQLRLLGVSLSTCHANNKVIEKIGLMGGKLSQGVENLLRLRSETLERVKSEERLSRQTSEMSQAAQSSSFDSLDASPKHQNLSLLIDASGSSPNHEDMNPPSEEVSNSHKIIPVENWPLTWARIRMLRAGGDKIAQARLEIAIVPRKEKKIDFETSEMKVMEILNDLGRSGDVKAQYELGMFFLKMSQLPDPRMRKKSEVRKATDASGDWSRQNQDVAKGWFTEAAERQYPPAQFKLGMILIHESRLMESEEERRENLAMAKEWFIQAAKRGYPPAVALLKRLNDQ